MGTCGGCRETPAELMVALRAHRVLWKLSGPRGHVGGVGAHGDLWKLWRPVDTCGVHGHIL